MNPVEQIFANAFSTTTTTKEKPVKTTTKARKHTVKSVRDTSNDKVSSNIEDFANFPAIAEIVEAPVDIVAVTASAIAEAINYDAKSEEAKQALRSACVASSVAVDAGVSLRTLEAESKVAGKKISKTSFARYAKVGALLIADPSLDADEALAKIYKEEHKARAKAEKAKASKVSAETEGAEGDADSTEAVVALTVDQIVAQLTEHGAEAIADVTANLIASLQDDHEVFATLAVALLRASANTVPLDQQDRGNLFNASADALSA